MTNNLARRIWDYRNSLNFCNFGRHKNFIYVATFELKDEETAKAKTLDKSHFNERDRSVAWYNILKEVRRGRCLKCCLCGEKGATMTCNNPKCQATV